MTLKAGFAQEIIDYYFKFQMELRNLDADKGYLISCVSIPDDFFVSQAEKLGEGVMQGEKLITHITEMLGEYLKPYEPMIMIRPDMIALLLPCDPQEYDEDGLFVSLYVEKLQYALDKIEAAGAMIGIGGYARNMQEINKCFHKGVYCLRIASVMAPDEKVVKFKDFYTEYELLSIPKQEREHFFSSVLGELLKPENSLWLETLEYFFRKDKSGMNTSDSLYIHRNTLLFRLHKIEKITGLNPQSFKDSVTLYSALALWRLKDLDEAGESAV